MFKIAWAFHANYKCKIIIIRVNEDVCMVGCLISAWYNI